MDQGYVRLVLVEEWLGNSIHYLALSKAQGQGSAPEYLHIDEGRPSWSLMVIPDAGLLVALTAQSGYFGAFGYSRLLRELVVDDLELGESRWWVQRGNLAA